MEINKSVVTSIRVSKDLPNRIQLANIIYEQKTGKKRTVYEFYCEAVTQLLKKENVK